MISQHKVWTNGRLVPLKREKGVKEGCDGAPSIQPSILYPWFLSPTGYFRKSIKYDAFLLKSFYKLQKNFLFLQKIKPCFSSSRSKEVVFWLHCLSHFKRHNRREFLHFFIVVVEPFAVLEVFIRHSLPSE